ncbi:MAG: hypothetical protein ACI8UO_001274 [Verrucomicrobiales bacterium]|jgi:hypothetical protein
MQSGLQRFARNAILLIVGVLAGGFGWEWLRPRPAAPLAVVPSSGSIADHKMEVDQQGALIVVTAISTISFVTESGYGLPDQEQQAQTLGLIIDETGRVLVSNSAIDLSVGMVGNRGRSNGSADEFHTVTEARSDFSSIQLNLSDGGQFDATTILVDEALDFRILQIEPAQLKERQNPIPTINLANRATRGEVLISQPVVGLARTSPEFSYAPAFFRGTVTEISDLGPYLPIWYVTDCGKSQGIPIFDLDGRFIGLTVQRIVDGQRTNLLGTVDAETISGLVAMSDGDG